MTPSQLIAFLNAMHMGDLDGLKSKLAQAREAVEAMGHEDLASILRQASEALAAADLKTFRKRIETAVAKLGHLR